MKDIESLVLGPTLRLPHFIGQNGQEVCFTTTFSNVCRCLIQLLEENKTDSEAKPSKDSPWDFSTMLLQFI